MTDKNCKNCNGTEIYSNEVSANGRLGGLGSMLLPIKDFDAAKFNLRVCGSCGFTEWFVPERFLANVKETFYKEPN